MNKKNDWKLLQFVTTPGGLVTGLFVTFNQDIKNLFTEKNQEEACFCLTFKSMLPSDWMESLGTLADVS